MDRQRLLDIKKGWRRMDLAQVVPELIAAVGEGQESAAEKALDDIAALCGCPEWDYPGQLVRDVRDLKERLYVMQVEKSSASEYPNGFVDLSADLTPEEIIYDLTILDANARTVIADLHDIENVGYLHAINYAEVNGKARKTVLAALEKRLSEV